MKYFKMVYSFISDVLLDEHAYKRDEITKTFRKVFFWVLIALSVWGLLVTRAYYIKYKEDSSCVTSVKK